MENLASYLNDHLAGSVAALQLLDRLVETYGHTPTGPFFTALRDEIQADQNTLQRLIAALGVEETTTRKAGAWLLEKLSHAKIHLAAAPEGDMGLFLALEALVLGITGKKSLWRALAASKRFPPLTSIDYACLEERAQEQRARVEAKRLDVARHVLSRVQTLSEPRKARPA